MIWLCRAAVLLSELGHLPNGLAGVGQQGGQLALEGQNRNGIEYGEQESGYTCMQAWYVGAYV